MTFDPKLPYNDLPFLPPENITLEGEEYNNLLLKARTALAELKGYTHSLPNPLLLLSPAILTEAIESSEIENIHTTIANVLEGQIVEESERSDADKKIINYKKALLWGAEHFNDYAISTRLITGIFEKMFPEESGSYRRTGNQIIDTGSKEPVYTPPDHTEINQLMQNWEDFVNKNDDFDPLVKAALAHYQFESIHPFEDGNGRTGRILIVLQLMQEDIIHWPLLYISGYISKTKSEYYQSLRAIPREGAWENFIFYMLKGFYQQAQETKKIMFDIINYRDKFAKDLESKHRKIYSSDLVEVLFEYPFITPTKLADELGVHFTTASRYLKELKEGDLLTDKKSGRNHFYINLELLNIINKMK
jgi:Fic family protein